MEKYLNSAVLILILFCACEDNNRETPEFIVVNTALGLKDYKAPFILITIENAGSAPGYNVLCEIIAKNETRIVDSGFAYFNLGDQILPGERFNDETVFHRINSHNAYLTLEYKFKWTALP